MTSFRTPARRAAATAAVTGAVLALAACGGNDTNPSGQAGHGSSHSASASASGTAAAPGSASAPDTAHNAADTAFAQSMIPHHQQAVEMADLAATRASAAEVMTLAAEIKKAQDPEIKTLSGWLKGWGEQIPAAGADHSGHGMAGMMGEDDMSALESASGAEFDTAFLKLMVKHHEGAVTMSKTEQSQGANPAAKDLAGRIVTAQSAEITRMNGLLDR
ncbi:DUF305 domain-containing protein [Streptomyces odonnellii]|uniref:DUF305 domain-containing protein n=1 Tax=Streptomyces odonnellii TaxID=1417980 RepID=UPI000626C8E0|nr:DUF305 domain-containing protein [Streptomyces odonnellii]